MENVTNGKFNTSDTQLATFDEIDKAIIDLKGRFDGRVYDPTTTAGMKDAKADRLEVRNIRTSIERNRKDFKAAVLARGRLIDSTAKRLTEAVRGIEDPIHKLIQEEEGRKAVAKAEKERLERVRIETIQGAVQALRFELTEMHSSDALSQRLADLACIDIEEETYQEFSPIAEDVLTEAMKQCAAALKIAQDREAAEAQKLADQKAEDERLAEEQVKLDKEKEEFRLQKEEDERQDKEKSEADEAERERVRLINIAIIHLRETSLRFRGKTSAEINDGTGELMKFEIDDSFMEFKEQAKQAIELATKEMGSLFYSTLNTELADAARKEEAKRLESQKKEQDERQAKLDEQEAAAQEPVKEEAPEVVEPEPTAMRACIDDGVEAETDHLAGILEICDSDLANFVKIKQIRQYIVDVQNGGA